MVGGSFFYRLSRLLITSLFVSGSFDFASQTADIELFCSQHGTTLQCTENPREQIWLHMVIADRDNMLMTHDHLMMQYAAQPS